MVVIREGIKYACNSCLSGHRTSKCGHSDRELIEIKKKGRPNSSCEICAGLRLKNSKHVRCGHLDKDGKEFNKKIQRNSKKSSDRSAISNSNSHSPIASTSKLPILSATSLPSLATLAPAPLKVCFCGNSCSCSGCYLHDPLHLKVTKFSEKNLHQRSLGEESGCQCGTLDCVGLEVGIEELLRGVGVIHGYEGTSTSTSFSNSGTPFSPLPTSPVLEQSESLSPPTPQLYLWRSNQDSSSSFSAAVTPGDYWNSLSSNTAAGCTKAETGGCDSVNCYCLNCSSSQKIPEVKRSCCH